MQVTIDKNSGYCFGVEFAIKMAEDEMEDKEPLYCLGDIVHNDMEVKRLTEKGLVVIDREKLQERLAKIASWRMDMEDETTESKFKIPKVRFGWLVS
jgi:4-hydroxy-3-methylbut-2-enyl diphosphate reductase IspH